MLVLRHASEMNSMRIELFRGLSHHRMSGYGAERKYRHGSIPGAIAGIAENKRTPRVLLIVTLRRPLVSISMTAYFSPFKWSRALSHEICSPTSYGCSPSCRRRRSRRQLTALVCRALVLESCSLMRENPPNFGGFSGRRLFSTQGSHLIESAKSSHVWTRTVGHLASARFSR